MKLATHDVDWVANEGEDEVAGLSLGWDFTAEHECGIAPLSRKLGLKGDKIGIERRQIRNASAITFYCDHSGAILTTKELSYKYVKEYTHLTDMLTKEHYAVAPWGEQELVAAWDDKDFSVFVRGEKVEWLAAIYAATQAKDAHIMLSGGKNPFANRGLAIGIISKMPQTVLDSMRESDLDVIRLKKADEATGVTRRLREAGRKWFALSPRWVDEKERERTQHPVIYWLNPMNQEENAYGWFTVEELDQWAQGEGPIPGNGNRKKREERTQRIREGSIEDLFSDEICCANCGIINPGRHALLHRARQGWHYERCPKCQSEDIIKPAVVDY